MKFTCRECGREFGQITGKHVRTHGFNTVAEYLEKHPGAETVRERKDSAKTIERKRRARTGKRHSEEAKARIGAGNRGKKMSAEAIDRWRKSYAKYIEENGSPLVGRGRGEDFRRKMSEIARNRPREMVDAKVAMMLAARRRSKATPEQRERYRAARLKYMAENPDKLPAKMFDTKPEREFRDQLDLIGCSYIRNKQIQGKLFDFCINDSILIEIDGPYHWNFKMYGNQTMPDDERIALFEEAKKNDILKNKIAVSNGYKIYRIQVGGSLPDDWHEQLTKQGFDLF